MNMNKLDQSLPIMPFTQHVFPRFMFAHNLGISEIENTERTTVHREDCPHPKNVAVEVGRSFGIADTETDVVQFPANGLWRLLFVCSWNGRRHS